METTKMTYLWTIRYSCNNVLHNWSLLFQQRKENTEEETKITETLKFLLNKIQKANVLQIIVTVKHKKKYTVWPPYLETNRCKTLMIKVKVYLYMPQRKQMSSSINSQHWHDTDLSRQPHTPWHCTLRKECRYPLNPVNPRAGVDTLEKR
jgi:hypothetical protein